MDLINRTFVGIPVPSEISQKMQEGLLFLKRKPGVENIRWNAPSEYLIQLASLGELSPATISAIKVLLPPVIASFPRFRLEVKGFSGTPNLIQPRFAHAELAGDVDRLQPISETVDRAVSAYVPARDTRGFKPNIPVGRLKTESEQLRVALGRALKMTQVPEMGTIDVDAICLLVSRANEFEIGYDVVARMPLLG